MPRQSQHDQGVGQGARSLVEVFGDQDNDGSIDLNDLILAQVTGIINFDTAIGGSIQAAGFARNRNGETEIVVPFNLPNFIN